MKISDRRMRDTALERGFRLEKVRGEDMYIIRDAKSGERVHHTYQYGTRARIIEWLFGKDAS